MLAPRLIQLDRTSTQFPEQLDKLLHDKEWVEGVQVLPEDELMEAIGYLDDVRLISTSNRSYSSPDRFLTASIAWVRHPENVSTYCRKFAVHEWFSPRLTKCLANSHSVPWRWSHMVDSVTPTGGLSAERVFASNDFGYPPRVIRKWLKRYLILKSSSGSPRPDKVWRHFVMRQWCGNTSIIRISCPSRVSHSNLFNSCRSGWMVES